MKPFALPAALAALTLASSAYAQAPAAPPAPVAPPAAPPPLLNARAELKAPMSLKVTSKDYAEGGVIPLANSGYGASISPSLAIAGAPKATKGFVVLMEDPDSSRDGLPILHWLAYDTPAVLPAGLPTGASLTEPVALMQGPNVAGQPAYRGPHPRPGAAHHYHLEVFALDTVLPAGVADRTALAQAMAGHVLAQGELVGLFSAPPPAPAP